MTTAFHSHQRGYPRNAPIWRHIHPGARNTRDTRTAGLTQANACQVNHAIEKLLVSGRDIPVGLAVSVVTWLVVEWGDRVAGEANLRTGGLRNGTSVDIRKLEGNPCMNADTVFVT